MLTLDITKHPCNAASVLVWILGVWDESPNAPALVVTHAGDGKALINRVRVRLSNARKALEKQGFKQNEFTVRTEITPWADWEGKPLEAVTFTRKVGLTHKISEAMKDMTLETIRNG